jgi:hypothetical protein
MDTEHQRCAIDHLAGLLKLELEYVRDGPGFALWSWRYRAIDPFTNPLTKGKFLSDYKTLPYLSAIGIVTPLLSASSVLSPKGCTTPSQDHRYLFDESYSPPKKDSKDIGIEFIKINDRQRIELFNKPPTHRPNMMSHLRFTVDDIEAMRTQPAVEGLRCQTRRWRKDARRRLCSGWHAGRICAERSGWS